MHVFISSKISSAKPDMTCISLNLTTGCCLNRDRGRLDNELRKYATISNVFFQWFLWIISHKVMVFRVVCTVCVTNIYITSHMSNRSEQQRETHYEYKSCSFSFPHTVYIRLRQGKNQVSRARTCNCTQQVLWDVIAGSCSWYMFLTQDSYVL